MNVGQRLNQHLISLLVRPFAKNNPIEFRSSLRKSSRFLVLSPDRDTASLEKTMDTIQTVFPRGNFTVLRSGPEAGQFRKSSAFTEVIVDLPKPSYWALTRSPGIRAFISRRFDVLMDLDSNANLLGWYLCRAMRIPLRIGLAKPHSDTCYNMVYFGKPDATGVQKVNGLVQFLKSFVSTP